MAYRDTILATGGLYAYYEFSETSGTTADNSQGTATYDGTFTGIGMPSVIIEIWTCCRCLQRQAPVGGAVWQELPC
jgi:hypothetical protein